MSNAATIEITVLTSVSQISADEWDSVSNSGSTGQRPLDPFTTHRFLKALEDSGSVGQGTGWVPRHLIARQDGRLIAAMPLFAKGHSQGA